MKNGQLEGLMRGIDACGDLKGVKFAFGLAKNKKMLVKEFEIFQEAIKPSKEFIEYDQKRVDLCKELADKDEKGNPKMESNNYIVIKNKEDFEIRSKALTEQNQSAVDDRSKQIKEFNELMNKESDFKPFLIARNDIPDDITSKQLSGIIDLIEEK